MNYYKLCGEQIPLNTSIDFELFNSTSYSGCED